MEMEKIKIATEVLGCCAGCQISILDLNEKILDILDSCDLVYSPILMDKKSPEKLKVAFVTGCVRNEENRKRAMKIREAAEIVVGLGSCACFGGIPGLGNLFSNEEILDEVYTKTKSTVNEKGVIPDQVPRLEPRVYALDQVIDVDLKIPGCPPPVKLIEEVLTCLLTGKKFELPKKTVCDECKRDIEEKHITVLKRSYQNSDSKKCLLEQGFFCMGPATMSGCGAVCPQAGIGCEGCMGPTDAVKEQGSKMLSALASVVDNIDLLKESKNEFVADPIGSFYRFTLPKSIIQKRVEK